MTEASRRTETGDCDAGARAPTHRVPFGRRLPVIRSRFGVLLAKVTVHSVRLCEAIRDRRLLKTSARRSTEERGEKCLTRPTGNRSALGDREGNMQDDWNGGDVHAMDATPTPGPLLGPPLRPTTAHHPVSWVATLELNSRATEIRRLAGRVPPSPSVLCIYDRT